MLYFGSFSVERRIINGAPVWEVMEGAGFLRHLKSFAKAMKFIRWLTED